MMRFLKTRRWRRWLFVGLAWLATSSLLWAQPNVISLGKVQDLQLTGHFPLPVIDQAIPFVLQIQADQAAGSDRHLTLIVSNQQYGPSQFTTIAHEVTLPAGETRVETTLSIPRLNHELQLDVSLLEEGFEISRQVRMALPFLGQSEVFPQTLFLGSEDRDVTGLVAAFGPSPSGQRNINFRSLTMTQNYQGNFQPARDETLVKHISNVYEFAKDVPSLPTRARDYSGLDWIVGSLAEFHEVALQQPAAAEAIDDWLRSGGNVVILETGDRKDLRLRCEEQFHLTGCKWQQWSPAGCQPIFTQLMRDRQDEFSDLSQKSGATPPRVIQDAAELQDICWRNIGLGKLVLWSRDPDPKQPADERLHWYAIRKICWSQEHPYFDRLTMSLTGVGRPPIKAYILGITFFAIAVGPLNLWLLRKRRQLWLLFFTAPLLSLLTTLGIVGYAIASEGFATHTCLRAFTLLDPNAEKASTVAFWAYYAGMAPRGGLTFSENELVLPVLHQDSIHIFRQGSVRTDCELRMDRGQQQLINWIPSRTQTEISYVATVPTKAHLAVKKTGLGPAVENQLGGTLRYLFLWDTDGKIWCGQNIPIATETPLQGELTTADRGRLRDYLTSAGIKLDRTWSAVEEPNRVYSYPLYCKSVSLQDFFSADLNRSLQPQSPLTQVTIEPNDWLDIKDATLGPIGQLLKSGRGFVAVVSGSDLVPNGGVSAVSDPNDFHLVFGEWK